MIKFNNILLEDLNSVAQKIKQILIDSNIKTIVFLGEMGAGKTTLITKICQVMGITETVTSPTFAIVNEYKSDNLKVNHFDFYRVNNIKEIFDIGFDEYLRSEDYNFIEWPEIILDYLSENYLKISILIENDKKRTIMIQ